MVPDSTNRSQDSVPQRTDAIWVATGDLHVFGELDTSSRLPQTGQTSIRSSFIYIYIDRYIHLYIDIDRCVYMYT